MIRGRYPNDAATLFVDLEITRDASLIKEQERV
jgi:hypothetical protein